MLSTLIVSAFIVAGVLMLIGLLLPDPDKELRNTINKQRDKERTRARLNSARRAYNSTLEKE